MVELTNVAKLRAHETRFKIAYDGRYYY